MNSLNHSKPLTFEERMNLIVGLGKGTFTDLEPLPTKEELIADLKEEMNTTEVSDQMEFKTIIQKIEKMSDEEFILFYDSVPSFELINDQIVQIKKTSK